MKADKARLTAFEVCLAVQTQDTYANLLLPAKMRERGLKGRDAAFATELTYGALRMRGRYDAIIAKAAKRPVDELDGEVVVALRLGVHQALGMRVPPHAAVSTTVELVRSARGKGAAGFANAVMRRVVEADLDVWLTRIAPGTSRESLATRHSHPAWVVGELEQALVRDGRPGQVEDLLVADNAPPSVTLVARPGLIERDDLTSQVDGSTPTVLSPWGVSLPAGDPGDVAAVSSGRAAVQDEGSQLAAAALIFAEAALGADAHTAGLRWLDMCAGPGGKAALLAAHAASRGEHLDAWELHPHRADLVTRALQAVDPEAWEVSTGDARARGEAGAFDRVLLDAPCTGLGALRRRPESRWRRTPSDLEDLVDLQVALINQAARLVSPGGVVAYVTCSPVIAETHAIVAASGLRRLDTRLALAAATDTTVESWGSGPHVQLWPHVHGTDAMFIQLLQTERSADVTVGTSD
ncbi:RsmB/NOP family class I SAM-dependent RNA methyltransferase [Demequina globuliformis]|uniref:RsmB/NOP family class I SAM-dependent RNA methyltransferase n=1 Tax=Demequina globuliformis TaxID=676202 RepID=UPI000785F53E|nr:transcription antitermination factor NusB [Demequina globuliformis]